MKHSELSVQYRMHLCKQKLATDIGMLLSGYKRCNDLHNNKYELIKFTKLDQNNHYFSYLSTKKYCVTGSILNWEAVQLSILHTLTKDAVSSFYVRIWNKLDSEIVLINWTDIGEYWHSLGGFLQPTQTNIQQYQFNNPIVF